MYGATMSFGTDPEFFITRNGQYFSAIHLLPPQSQGKSFYFDNVLAELNVAPAHGKEAAVANIRQALATVADFIKPYQLEIKAFQRYPVQQLQHPLALIANCLSEYCVYDCIEVDNKEVAKIIATTTMRSAGGHIHLGDDILTYSDNVFQAVRLLDLFLSPLSLLDQDGSAANRKKLYGKAGRHRRPPYGVEYRVLSNFWLSSPGLVELTYDLCELVVKLVQDDVKMDYDKEKVRESVNCHDLFAIKGFLPFIDQYFPITNRLAALTTRQSFYSEWGLSAHT